MWYDILKIIIGYKEIYCDTANICGVCVNMEKCRVKQRIY